MSEKVNQRLYNAMVEVAVCEFWEQKIDEIDWNPEGEHIFSDQHKAVVQAALRKQNRQRGRRRAVQALKRVAAALVVVCSLAFAMLMSSESVRAEAHDFVMRILRPFLQQFWQEYPDAPLDGDEMVDFQSDGQIEQLAGMVASALEMTGLPSNTELTFHVDGHLNLRVTGLEDGLTIEDALPFLAETYQNGLMRSAFAETLSSAYSSETQNRLYFVQRAIRERDIASVDPSGATQEERTRYRQIIRSFMLDNGLTDENEIMLQERVIRYADGKFIFEEK
jgi:hypothetical protein